LPTLDRFAREIAAALSLSGLLSSDALSSLVVDTEPTFATAQVLETDPPDGLTWAHIAIPPGCLRPEVGDLVYTANEAEWFGDDEALEKPDALAVPLVHVTCLSQPISLTEAGRRVVATSWAFLEFNYEDARVCPEIHTIRAPDHPLFSRLSALLQSPVQWAVVVG